MEFPPEFVMRMFTSRHLPLLNEGPLVRSRSGTCGLRPTSIQPLVRVGVY
eukprot:SAG11_NODE_30880_length_296_cov_2.289340_1_plen_49_part_01